MTPILLGIRDLTLSFRGIRALDGVSLEIPQGTICSLIGPNGAGKTSLFNCVSGLYLSDSGTIEFDGNDLRKVAPHRIPSFGIMRTYQNLGLIAGLSVLENILVGAHHRTGFGFMRSLVAAPSVKRQQRALQEEARGLAAELSLGDHLDRDIGSLPYGTLKRVEIARALMGQPRLLLLDEPAGGLNHAEVDELSAAVVAIRDTYRLTILLVEHHMHMVMGLSDHVVVMHLGKDICSGPPAMVAKDEAVIAAYLGDAA